MLAFAIAFCLSASLTAGRAAAAKGSDAPLGPVNLTHAGFTTDQMDALVGTRRPQGSETRMQIFYHYFKAERDPAIVAPAWLDASLKTMLQRPAWKDPDEGVLNEAQLWQAPPSVLYEFFEMARKTFPTERGGAGKSPPFSYRDIDDECVRYFMTVDRLRRAKLGSSLGGRGRVVIADFQRIIPEMRKARDAAKAGDARRYIAAVMAVASISDAAFDALR
jgi:hypothetical protein